MMSRRRRWVFGFGKGGGHFTGVEGSEVHMSKHSLSVIIATYNQPNALPRVLTGFLHQEDPDFDMVIADDGSDAGIAELIRSYQRLAPFEIKHVWQEDRGFRKARALNVAVHHCEGRQILFCDGDCVPFLNLVKVHRESFREGEFCVGGYIFLGLDASRSLTFQGIAAGEHHRFLSPELRRVFRKVHIKNRLYRVLGKRKKPKVLGGNLSVDRQAFIAINGFDEAFDNVGQDDSDLRNRLRNWGAKGISLWTRAFVVHLHHGMDPTHFNPERPRTRSNMALYRANQKRIRIEKGWNSHIKRPKAPPGAVSSPSVEL
jgi:glycosyltransferase involved in cell wall biosynthesis